MSSAKSESLTSWPIWIPFISLCCLIVEAKTSNTMLNNSGESGHPCLVPDLRGKALSFFPLRMILALGRSYMALNDTGLLMRLSMIVSEDLKRSKF